MNFDRLIATDGVRSIVLNGFNLSANVTPAVDQTPGIFLYGGVQTLKFNDIDAIIDTSVSTNPTLLSDRHRRSFHAPEGRAVDLP